MRELRFPGESVEHRRARVLRSRVDDLRDARERIIAAADAERRRIERDLHDGAKPREEAQLAIKELRELAHGIHPAVLSEHGLGAALKALATRAPVPVDVIG